MKDLSHRSCQFHAAERQVSLVAKNYVSALRSIPKVSACIRRSDRCGSPVASAENYKRSYNNIVVELDILTS